MIYIIKNYIKYSRDKQVDIYIEPSSSSSSSSSSSLSIDPNEPINNAPGLEHKYGSITAENKRKRLSDSEFRRKKICKCFGVLIYLTLLILSGELCVYSANQ